MLNHPFQHLKETLSTMGSKYNEWISSGIFGWVALQQGGKWLNEIPKHWPDQTFLIYVIDRSPSWSWLVTDTPVLVLKEIGATILKDIPINVSVGSIYCTSLWPWVLPRRDYKTKMLDVSYYALIVFESLSNTGVTSIAASVQQDLYLFSPITVI